MNALIARPGDTFIAWTLICIAALLLLVDLIRKADRELQERIDAVLAQGASDHHEPTRAQVEWELHVAEAVRLAQEDDLAWRTMAELEFAASVQADIDELPGGDAA